MPADGKLLSATHLSVNESTLTGEPLCQKSTDEKDFDMSATYPTSCVMKGTSVMEGHGIMQVEKVGDSTEQGKVFKASQIDNGERTPLDEQLSALATWITKMSYIVGGGIVIGRLLVYFQQGTPFEAMHFIAYVLQTLMIAVTLVVVSVPEGLPMAVTLSLAYSMRRMLKTNNLVRKMHACETMGATTVICTDKTGTLTENQMRVAEVKTLFEKGNATSIEANAALYAAQERFLEENMAVNSTAQLDFSKGEKPEVLGNPTEGALLLWLNAERNADYQALRSQAEIVEELPFTTERKYMAVILRSSVAKGKHVLYVKGAPEIVARMCALEASKAEGLQPLLLSYQRKAMRTLGFAYKVLDEGEVPISGGRVAIGGLSLQAVVAISDPVRKEVPLSVGECLKAGIKIKVVTGDTSETAKEIARQIGLWQEGDDERNIITGPEFAALSDEELNERILDFKIISRARPMDKKRLVNTLQQKGEVVAVTGDGTNDAPALKAAHVGLSMGDGTSVAKEASDITIVDNSFSSIGKAVMWGRSLYQNIQRFLLFQLTVNVTACLLVLVGAFMGTESPLTVTQMLWINLIMDTFAAVALASLPPSKSVMKDKPRDRKAFILSPGMKGEVMGVGGCFFLMLIALLLVFKHNDITSMRQLLDVDWAGFIGGLLSLAFWTTGSVTAYELTLLFTIFVMTHFFYLFNARAFASHRSALHFKGCRGLLLISTIIFFGQIAMVETPILQNFFNVVSLRAEDWAIIIVLSSFVLWIREGWNCLFKR